MQDQRIEKLAAVAINITKVLLIIYLGFEEVFKIIKSLQKLVDAELDISRKWASQNYSILKKRLAEQKIAKEFQINLFTLPNLCHNPHQYLFHKPSQVL